MAPVNARWLTWTARRLGERVLRRAGWGGVAVALSLLAAAGAWLTERALAAEVARAQRAAAESSQAAALRAAAIGKTGNPPQELQAFEASLPAAQERMQVLSDLFELAESHELLLARGEYQLQHDEKAGLDSFRITLPLKGHPAVVQRFVQEALARNRALAFDALTLKRDKVDSAVIEAKVQFSLFLRAAKGAQ
jgi:hypothetical protein